MYEIYEKLLKEKGLTSYKVSKATGISQTTLSAWKHSGNPPKIERLRKIAEFLGVSIDYLTGNTYDNEPAIIYRPKSKDISVLIETAEKLDPDKLNMLLTYAKFLKEK